MRTVHLLVNPASRRGAADANEVEADLERSGFRVLRLSPSGPDAIADEIERADPERVVAVGGDGLIHDSLPALAGTTIVLGIVPSGTGNDFARSLGLPRRRRSATRRSLGPDCAVDLLRVAFDDGTSAFAATVVTSGFSGRVNKTANERSFPRGQLKYTAASFTELRRLRSSEVVVEGSPELSGPSTIVAVANTRHFGGGMAIAPRADPTDGLLDLTIVGDVTAWQLALVLPTVFVGQHVHHPLVHTTTAKSVGIQQTDEVWADGERIGSGAFTVEVIPAGLRVAAF